MKIINYIFAVLAFTFVLTGCSNENEEASIDSINQNSSSSKLKVRGDNKYDMLGFAFDATGPYLDVKKTAYPVLDIVKLNAAGLITSDEGVHTELDIKSGSDAKTLLKKLNAKFSIGGSIPIEGMPFTASLDGEFTSTRTLTSKFSYAFADMNVYAAHHTIKQTTLVSTLQDYLSDSFKADLLTLTPEQIISLYGTHVYTDIYTGGRLRFIYKSYVNTVNNEGVISFGAKMGIGKATDILNAQLSSTTTITETATSNFQQESMSFKSIGGTGASIIGTWTPGMPPIINFNQWSSTVSKNNACSLQLIDVGDNSLMAIYELVADPNKKAALKAAIDNYIIGKAITVLPVVPLYRYSNTNTNHLYTTNWNEIGIGGNGWNYEGIQAFIFKNQEANTVPLYRFYTMIRKKTGFNRYTNYMDHYYTIVKSSGVGYTNEGVIGYVYPTSLSGSVGLRQYYNPSNCDHFYTTSGSELGSGQWGYSYNGDCCYVIDGTR